MTGISVGGLSRWVPLDLGVTAESVQAYAHDLAVRFPATPSADVVGEGLAGTALELVRRSQQDEDVRLLAAWVFTVADDDLSPLALATLRALRFDPRGPAPDVTSLVLGDGELVSAPTVTSLSTPSGSAELGSARIARWAGRERIVHETTAVLWSRADDAYVVVLSSDVTDLVAGHEVPDAVAQLAQQVSGL
jgi:hypothetical protein